MNYMEELDHTFKIDGKIIDLSLTRYLKKLLKENFRDLKTLRKSAKDLFDITRNIPLFFNQHLLLVPIFFKNGIVYINYLEVKKIIINKDETKYYFNNSMVITLKISRYRSEELVRKAEIIRDYMLSFD